MSEKGFGVLICCLLLIFQPAFGASPAAIGTVNGNGHAQVNGAVVPNGAVLYTGDEVATTSSGAAFVFLANGDKLALGSSTVAHVVANDKGFTVSLDQGRIAAVTQKGMPVVVLADGVTIQPKLESGSYEVALNGNDLQVLSRNGTTLAEAPNRTAEVREGELLKANMTQGPTPAGKSKKQMVLVALIAAGVVGAGLGVALAEPTRKCVSQSGLTCP